MLLAQFGGILSFAGGSLRWPWGKGVVDTCLQIELAVFLLQVSVMRMMSTRGKRYCRKVMFWLSF